MYLRLFSFSCCQCCFGCLRRGETSRKFWDVNSNDNVIEAIIQKIEKWRTQIPGNGNAHLHINLHRWAVTGLDAGIAHLHVNGRWAAIARGFFGRFWGIWVQAAMPNFRKLMDGNQTTAATFYASKIPFVTEINCSVSFLLFYFLERRRCQRRDAANLFQF